MSTSAPQPIGDQLYRILPAIYRTRDDGSLEGLLDVFGGMLDEVRATLDQLLADAVPSLPGDERQTQSWLLPYFAELVDAQLRSPNLQGRNAEVANALLWRKAKGTVHVLQDIAAAMTQPRQQRRLRREVAVQEGFTRVATTAQIDIPILPASALGEPDIPRSQSRCRPPLRRGSRAFRPCSSTCDSPRAPSSARRTTRWRRASSSEPATRCGGDSSTRAARPASRIRSRISHIERSTCASPMTRRARQDPGVSSCSCRRLWGFSIRAARSPAAVILTSSAEAPAPVTGQRIGTLMVTSGVVQVTGCWPDRMRSRSPRAPP